MLTNVAIPLFRVPFSLENRRVDTLLWSRGKKTHDRETHILLVSEHETETRATDVFFRHLPQVLFSVLIQNPPTL